MKSIDYINNLIAEKENLKEITDILEREGYEIAYEAQTSVSIIKEVENDNE